MGNIAAGDIVYTDTNVYSARIAGLPPRKQSIVQVALGNSTNKTYPSGGIALDKGKLGMATFVDTVRILDTSGSETALWTWDNANQKLRAYTAEDTEKSGAFTNNTQTLVVEAVGF
jgi:hypothetical protein